MSVTTKHVFVKTKHAFCHDKRRLTNIYIYIIYIYSLLIYVTTKVLLQQNIFVVTSFVTTSILLWRQKMCFVVTKMVHVAAPANDEN